MRHVRTEGKKEIARFIRQISAHGLVYTDCDLVAAIVHESTKAFFNGKNPSGKIAGSRQADGETETL